MSMIDATKALTLVLALGVSAPAFAQETTPEAPATEAPATEAPATEAPATEAPATAADQLNMGTEAGAPAAPQDGPGSVYLEAKHGDWEQRCVKQEDGSDPCQLYQLLKDGNGNSVAEISLFPLQGADKAVAGATVIAPLETLLTENLKIAVDGGTAKIYPFTWCDQGGCVARIGFTAEEIAAFKKGNKAMMIIVPAVAPEQKVELNLSLAGFTAGYDAIAATAGN